MRGWVRACLLLSMTVGCGGNQSTGGASLHQQHQQALKTADARSRAIRLVQVAYKQHEAGDATGTHDSLAAAAEAARAIADGNEKAETLATVAYAAGTVGWMTEASKLAKELRAAIEQAPNPEVAAAALAKMAVVYGKHIGNATAAETYLRQAEETADKIETPESRAAALLAIAGRHHELNRGEESKRVATVALELARGIEDPRRRAETLAASGERLQKMGETEQAASVFGEAETVAKAMADNPVSQAYAFLKIAEKLQSAGLRGRAAQVLKTTEEIAFAIQDRGLQEPLLTQLNKQRNALP